MSHIDWAAIASQVGIDENSGNSTKAREAIAVLLGEDTIRQSVDYYISGGPGSELARHVLWQLHPWAAMLYCRDIGLSQAPENERTSAVELLRVVADERALPWVPQFLGSESAGVQFWGFLIVDQLIQSGFIEWQDASAVIELAEGHSNHQVREKAAEYRECLANPDRPHV